VWHCQGNDAQELWKRNLLKLSHWMKVQQTDPDIKKAIIGGLSYWYRPDTGTELNLPNSISIVYHEQETIGWNNMLEGFYHVGWQTLQQEYYHRLEQHVGRLLSCRMANPATRVLPPNQIPQVW
jgi:hypothetical protein